MTTRDKGQMLVVITSGIPQEQHDSGGFAAGLMGLLAIALVMAVFMGLINDVERKQQQLIDQQVTSQTAFNRPEARPYPPAYQPDRYNPNAPYRRDRP